MSDLFILTLESKYQQPDGAMAAVTWYTCKGCGAALVELGPNVEVRMVHELWHEMVPALKVPQ